MKFGTNVFICFYVCLIVHSSGARMINNLNRIGRLTYYEPSQTYFRTSINGDTNTYAFGYDIDDPTSGNNQFRNEQRYPNGTVVGSYGYMDANGSPVHFEYIADEKGYRVKTVRRRRRFR